MRTATPTQSVEKLLHALFEGTASDGPWVEHNGVAWEMEELACDESVDGPLAYQTALVTLANSPEPGVDRVLIHSGTGCQSTILYPYLEGNKDRPRASVGLTDLAIRAEHKRFLGDSMMTFAMPYKLFLEIEANVGNSCLVRQSWKDLVG